MKISLRLFLDAGSTLAHIASAIGSALTAAHVRNLDAAKLVTNNALAFLHLWLIHGLPCELFPSGTPEDEYGAAFGPPSTYEGDWGTPVPTSLSSKDQIKIDELKTLASSIFENPRLIITSAAGLQLRDREGSTSGLLGPYVNGPRPRLFKRFLVESKQPILYCMDYEKINHLSDNDEYYIFDADSWKTALKEHPIGFWVGFQNSKKNQSQLKTQFETDLNLKVRLSDVKKPYGTLLAVNDKFLEMTKAMLPDLEDKFPTS